MTPVANLVAIAVADIEQSTVRLLNTGTMAAWGKTMRASLTRAHVAGYVLGTADRLGTGTGTALVNTRNLSKAERKEIAAVVTRQLGYLKGFAETIAEGASTPRALTARAALYAGAIRETYNVARWGAWDLPFVPGDGSSECLGNCGCQIDVKDNGDGTGKLYWRLSGLERHCKTCPQRARRSPYAVARKRAA